MCSRRNICHTSCPCQTHINHTSRRDDDDVGACRFEPWKLGCIPGRVACPIFIAGCLHAFVDSCDSCLADVHVIATSAKTLCISSDGAPPLPHHRTSCTKSSPKANLPCPLELSDHHHSLPNLPRPPTFHTLHKLSTSSSTRAKRRQAKPNRLLRATRLQSLPKCHAGGERALRAGRAPERDESKTTRLSMDARRL